MEIMFYFLGTEDESCELEVLNLANAIRGKDISVINSQAN